MRRSEQYGRIPKSVLQDVELSDRAVRIYGILAMSVYQGNIARMGLRRVGELAGCSKATAQRAIKVLIDRGYVTAGTVRDGERAYYMLNSSIFGQKQRDGVETIVSYPNRRLATVRTA